MIKRYRSAIFLFLVVIAWYLYAVSLFLPACEPTRGDSHQPSGICWPGLDVLLLLLIPLFWIFGLPLVYLLVNVTFWLSLLFALFVPLRPHEHIVYTVFLGICAALAWYAAAIVETICIGYFLWSLSFTVMVIAFVFSSLVPAPSEAVVASDEAANSSVCSPTDNFGNIISLTDAAVAEIKRRHKRGQFDSDVVVRVEPDRSEVRKVSIAFDFALADGRDWIGQSRGIPIVVDRAIAPQLHGSTIDFRDGVFMRM